MPLTALRRTSGVTLSAALVAVTLAAHAPQAAAADTPSLRVLTYNTFLMSKNLYPNWGQDHRATEIARASFFQGNDVVVLQEAFDNSASDALAQNASAQYPYRTPVVGRSKSGWDATGGAYSAVTPEDGGVTVLSKWPIVRKEQFIYKDACGSDWWSNKGFVYAELNVNGTKVHVVGTHAQSTDSGCATGEAAQMRSRQFKQIDAFLDAKNIPASEQVIVAGDMNVDSRSPEYASMLADAGLAGADARTGHPYSFDTQDNSIALYRYPDDPREDLDYVLHRAGHAKPSGWTNKVVKEQSEPWTVSSWGTDYTYTNLSDHYPLIGSVG
ncbi:MULTISPECIES: sphingomyelin phosphodiesterase [Streptomyces]|uniref:sphingomyelin phosphodiesterase n=1 Tax=unclassified Streptomyces TaxID=2593676 RepID=UPI0008901C9F|nr:MULTISPECIES: sphingomyelin phosphodiesterase [unclassified Streptomyces]MDX2733547.1 sphingomyelin phosphodiesterase [Streptomyces sp. PA03-2a]MDX3770708.1 sphingomyelin phosphodiesterase [Streptomyces sp. AK08-01B]MDX3821052.1 sphingomyelin phosphodiesterase [Streptomyces sp. AK08-01A]SCZ16309.1 sphingomyelin phosphodiesterase [Streptomyces sp. 136MFCol5.1]